MKKNVYKSLSGAKQGLIALALAVVGSAYAQPTYTFSFTGAVQTLTLPAGNWGIECWGADGGDITAASGGGGKGGYSKGEINITASGTLLNILVGGKGKSAPGTSGTPGAGGWNGGGGGGKCGRTGAGGGGATDVRLTGTAASDRVIVAGGGGGAAYYSQLAPGGNGGGTNGQDGDIISSGNVLTVGGGGAGATGANPGLSPNGFVTTNGTATGGGGGGQSSGIGFGQPGTGGGPGGAAGNSGSGSTGSSGGGGGGYAGGAGGTQKGNTGAAGGGGSGYIGGVTNGITVQFGQAGYVPNPDVNGDGYVIITGLCDVAAAAAKNPICYGDQVVLSTNAGSGINWSTGANTQSITVSPTSNTSYTVWGISSSTMACTNTIVLTVTVNPLPNVSATGVPSVVCVGSTATLNAYGASTYAWSNATNGWSTTTSPQATSVYTVTGTDGNGCVNQNTVEVTLNTNTLSISPSAVSICSGTSETLTASGGAGTNSYTWFPQVNFASIIVSPTVNTTYVVAATDVHNCHITNSVQVTVMESPNIIASADRDPVCRGESVTLSAIGGDNYTWSNGITGATNTVKLNADVTYTYAVTGSGTNGCTGTGTVAVVVNKCTGVDEASAIGMNISPNPSRDIFRLTFENSGQHTIRVTDLTGRLLFETNSDGNQNLIDLGKYPRGVYSAQVISGSGSGTFKLIKE